MNSVSRLQDRLNQIFPTITHDSFLKSERLGNEIPFYAFDYAPEHEEIVKEHVSFLEQQLQKQRPDLKALHVNLLQLALDTLNKRKGNLYDASLKMQVARGDAFVAKALTGALEANKVASVLTEKVDASGTKIVLLSGIGSAYPLIRTHHLLNALQARLGDIPLVVFYPGVYTGQGLSLFGQLPDKPYYRAFRLVE